VANRKAAGSAMKRVAFLMTHPTQYHSPWFRRLAAQPGLAIHVYYGSRPDAGQQGEGFGVAFEWDIPLLEGYPHSFLKNVGSGSLSSFRGIDTPEIARVIESRGYDAWIINGWRTKSEWQAIRTCWRTGVPTFIRGDSNLLTARPIRTRIVKHVLYRRWVPRFSCYLTVGTLNERYYEHYGADRDRFVPVRHFVDNAWFGARAEVERKNRDRRRTAWGIRRDSLVLLFAGKFIPKKQPMDAVRAIEAAAKTNPNLHLLMVGAGPLRAECEAYCREKNLPVTFAGFLNQSDMPMAYASADALVMPSVKDETWGLVVNEAMASGLPALVSDMVGCGPDLVIPGETGDVFSAGDYQMLADLMLRYMRDRVALQAHGLLALDRVQGFSLDAAVIGTLQAVHRFAA
jgi:glycosyltransferase involved in cell wall biosynthesis